VSRVDRHESATALQRKPILLVDIDGVISLFGFPADRRPSGGFVVVDGIAHFLSGAAGPTLLDLGHTFDLVWCSGWEEKANEYLPHALRLAGPLPHLCFAGSPETSRTHWKLDAIDEHAGSDRALAWIDDGFNDACHEWAAARPGPTLLVPTEPPVGLTPEQVETLERWARAQADRATVVHRPSP
jgi:hypothetical protein